jgi:nucleotide-binding universal stress UspA family protein
MDEQRGVAVYKDIVVGTDGSETATEAVHRAAGLARQSGAKLRVVTAIHPISVARMERELQQIPEEHRFQANLDKEAEDIAEAAAAEVRDDSLEIETHPLEGDAADAILRVAEEYGSDLIVVGNKGMTGARRFVLGSVPNKISHHAPCDVLVVKTS